MFLKIFIFLCFLNANIVHCECINAIVKNYQEKLYTLPLIKQEHFSARMYLLTGDAKYITPVVSYSYFLSQRYQRAMSVLNHPTLLKKEESRLLAVDKKNTLKRKRYNQYIGQFKGMGFYLNLLIITNKVFSYHLEDTFLFPRTIDTVKALKNQRNAFKTFILNKTSIRIYGAQLINYVFYLSDLGILDLIAPYTEQFRHIFPDDSDEKLSNVDYESKIYGMTHFITAASHYYKNQVFYKDYHWIIDYFEKNIDRIITRADNDVIAEVGVCLMLVAHGDSPAITKIKLHLKQAFDSQHALIKDKSNNVDFVYGEHRNILAIMIFNWRKSIGKDPLIYATFNELLNKGIESSMNTNL